MATNMKPNINQKIEQRPFLLQALQQSVEILQMPQLELAAYVQEQIEKNPLLEPIFSRPQANPIDWEKASKPSLYQHLLTQARECFSNSEDLLIVDAWIALLDDRGFVTGAAEPPPYKILKILQTFDPPGIFARSLPESLLIQLTKKGKQETLAYDIVSQSFDELLHGRYSQIKKKHNAPIDEVKEAIQTLSLLSLRPAAPFDALQTQFIQADLRLSKQGNRWIVETIEEHLPQFRLRTDYLNLTNLPKLEKTTLREFATSARWLMRSLEKRRKFLLELASFLVKTQTEFLNLKGSLRSISTADLAIKFGVHESTISRALSEKYIATPSGYILFRALVPGQKNGPLELVQKIIAEEDRSAPLTDEQISNLMEQAGYKTARRTVAKYRRELRIQSASARKHLG